MIPQGKTLLEAFEMLDHFQAYEFLLKNLDKPLSEELLKETHRLLTEHTLSYRTQHDEHPSRPGEYTTVDMCAGDTIFGDHKELIKRVPLLLKSTQEAIDSDGVHPMIIAAKFHGFYEYLHPFRDGNGRIGRMFTNFILLKKSSLYSLFLVKKGGIYLCTQIHTERSNRRIPDRFFFKTAINRMQSEIQDKNNMTHNFIHGMNFMQTKIPHRKMMK